MAMRVRAAAFTLVELMVVLVVVGIIGAIAMSRNTSPAAYALQSQGDVLAASLRHTQALATTWSRSLTVALTAGTNGSYAVRCTSPSAAPPCNLALPVVDPATGGAFIVNVQNGVSISGPVTLTIDSSGRPASSAAYSLTGGGATVNVTVAATTGFVTVTH